MDDQNCSHQLKPTTKNLARAIFIVNRHAKTAPNPKFLYHLKKKALLKLINEGKAKKEGLHFSKNPKYSKQQSDVLISAGEYYFHIPPAKDDFEQLPHLGSLSQDYRNPRTHMSLSVAKKLLQSYTGITDETEVKKGQPRARTYEKPVFKKLGESYR
ncbi:YkyB family protein [Metabacillus fastidiosus]|uniref:YkyB family protein n=1 Tax=Metabacillus fastidiosus TaxID=1458 RepID=A0ABU6P333_9BACI|nr:YkyB family protein [Metabacillus fastidiosus]MEC2075180.1 YkyB family protein [Metabacillus fastidiosus]MED4403763.1 YkyB family protein [Metabacillus fastidiosus]MED4452542.1 YkyB family protein [Metabacillus fastidiosus]MED4463527.1 YkyB family protein [Metabacillus fastidiosus]MED4532886.1 YkyB family protein [Metabacillus fastidiosus]